MLGTHPKPWEFATADAYKRATVEYLRAGAREARAALRRYRHSRDIKMCRTVANNTFSFLAKLLWLTRWAF